MARTVEDKHGRAPWWATLESRLVSPCGPPARFFVLQITIVKGRIERALVTPSYRRLLHVSIIPSCFVFCNNGGIKHRKQFFLVVEQQCRPIVRPIVESLQCRLMIDVVAANIGFASF